MCLTSGSSQHRSSSGQDVVWGDVLSLSVLLLGKMKPNHGACLQHQLWALKNHGVHLGFCLIEVFALIAQYQRGEGAQAPWVKEAGPLMPHTAQSSPTSWAQLQAAPLGFFSALVCQRTRFKNGAKGTVDTTAWGLAQQCLYTLGCGCRQSGRKRKCKTTWRQGKRY